MDVYAIIPIRYGDCFNPDGSPRFLLGGRTLWDITFERVLESKVFREVIIAYDHSGFEQFIPSTDERLKGYLRPAHLSDDNYTTLDVLRHVADQQRFGEYDFLMLLEITHPLRPHGMIEEMAKIALAQAVDSLITVRPVRNNFWRREADGRIFRMEGTGDDSRVEMHKEILGVGSLFRVGALRGPGAPFGEKVDVAPIRKLWAEIDIRDDESLWFAERYLERFSSGSATPKGQAGIKNTE